MALAPPKCLAMTTGAGGVTHGALATEAEATAATATLAGAREAEDTKVARGVAVIEEEAIEEQAVATEEAAGTRGGAGGSYGRSGKSLTKVRFSPNMLFSACLPFQFFSTGAAL